MATYGRRWTGVNRGGSQSQLMHKGVGTNQNSGGANAQGTATSVTPMTATNVAPAASPVSDRPGFLPPVSTPAPNPRPAPTTTTPTSSQPPASNPPATGGVSGGQGQVVIQGLQGLPLNIEALIQQIMQSAFGKMNEARSQAEAEQQRAIGMVNTGLADANTRIQQALRQIQSQFSGIRFR